MHDAVILRDRSAALLSQPAIFICADCDVEEHALDGQLPAGWDKIEHRGCAVVRCTDCNEAIEREHMPAAPDTATAKPAGAADDDSGAQRIWPERISDALVNILGMKLGETRPVARAYRAAGFAIPREAAAEQAFVLHRMIHLWILHGDAWREAAAREFKATIAVRHMRISPATTGEAA
jgi:hypothetical protein